MWIYDHLVFRWTAEVLMAGAAFGCLYTLVACVVALRLGRDERRSGKTQGRAVSVPVTVLMPLCGQEPGLENRLRALCGQNYTAPVQVLCGVHDAADPAAAVANKVAAELPKGAIVLHVDPRLHGRNLKMSNRINMIDHARHDVFVMLDSDIDVGPDYLTRVVGELQKPGVGAVTCLYYGIAKGGIWAQLAAMGIDLQFLPSAMVALRFGLARPCFGATIAIARDTLREIGGLTRFADHLWDDYAIGEAVRAAGLRVAVPSPVVGHVCADASARELFARQFRYARTIGSIEPIGHVGAVVTHPLALALLAILAGGGEAAIALSATALITRAALCWCIEQRFGAGANSYWLLPLRDLAAFAVYVTSFFGGTVVWRG
ncbi:MAG: bacteriohopanetetrol glucosamine biosynthesis glycosyltransferase HpnI, partial [Candidatus Binataceae bacterium]